VNDYCDEILKGMYDDCLKKMGAKEGQSLLVSMTSRRLNTVKRAISESARELGSSQSIVVSVLQEKNLIKEVSPGKYILSAQGILYVEFKLRPLGTEYYVDWIDKEYLRLDNEPISDKNRVILLALFAMRCYSEENCATYSEKSKEVAFMSVLNDCCDFLSSMGLVKQNCIHSSIKSKSEMSSILNQIDRLPSSTGMKFRTANGGYYLDILSDGTIDRQAITFIARIILGDKVTRDSVSKLEALCGELYLKYGYIFLTGNQSFEDSISQYNIRNGIRDVVG